MTEIKLLNKIGKAGVDRFDGAKYTLSEDAAAPAGILVRSAAMHEMAFGHRARGRGRQQHPA